MSLPFPLPKNSNPLSLAQALRPLAIGSDPFPASALREAGWSPWATEAATRPIPDLAYSEPNARSEPFSRLLLLGGAGALEPILAAFPDFIWAFSPQEGFGISRRHSRVLLDSIWERADWRALAALGARVPEHFVPEPLPSETRRDILCNAFGFPREAHAGPAFFGFLSSPEWRRLRSREPREAASIAASLACVALARASRGPQPESDLESQALAWAREGARAALELDPHLRASNFPAARGALANALRLSGKNALREGGALFGSREGEPDADAAWLAEAASMETARECRRFARESRARFASLLTAPPKPARSGLLAELESLGEALRSDVPWRLLCASFSGASMPQTLAAAAEAFGPAPAGSSSVASFPLHIRPLSGLRHMASTFRGAGAAKAAALMPEWIRQTRRAAQSPLLPEPVRAAILEEPFDPAEAAALPPTWRKALRRIERNAAFSAVASIEVDWLCMALIAGASPVSLLPFAPEADFGRAADLAGLVLGVPLRVSGPDMALIESSRLARSLPEGSAPARRARL